MNKPEYICDDRPIEESEIVNQMTDEEIEEEYQKIINDNSFSKDNNSKFSE